jgi:threonine dehydrogenase-like Zn-dependent dehydrogenase
MRHAVFAEPGRVEWREAPDPKLQGDGEAIVRPIVVGRCDLDVAYLSGRLAMPAGAPIGHEIIAEVVEVGSGVKGFSEGQRVFVPAQINCGVCGACQRGQTGRCEAVPFGASYGMGREGGFGGGLADLVRVPFAEAMLTPTPQSANLSQLIGLADMATDAWRAVGPALEAHPSARVLVFGGGARVIGLYAAGLARAMGAAEVGYVDGDDLRASVAKVYGAERVLAGDIPTRGYDIVVVADPTAAALEQAFTAAAPGGQVISVTPTIGPQPSLDTRPLYHFGVTWTIGRPDCRHGRDGALAAWANCGFCPDRVPTRRVPWDDAPEAWADDTSLYVSAVRD